MLEAVSDPKHEEFDEYTEWLGEDFDPEEFSLATTNAILQRIAEQPQTAPPRRSGTSTRARGPPRQPHGAS